MNRLWARLSGFALGRWLFARLVCWKAPYFSTIWPRFEILEPGRCELSIRKRRSVLNHIGTVHAIAMCNMAELAAGCAMEATLPASHRWIPKGMSVDYLLKAETALRAIATIHLSAELGTAQEVAVPVRVLNTSAELVFQATVRIWVSLKRR
jgi:acyl-coenzyme A thioesterase PaaI-like protein